MRPSDERPFPAGDDGLERLLDAAGEVELPAGLVERLERALAARGAEARLERLLERLPPPGVPAGLAGRVLERLAAHRARAARPRGPRRRRLLLAAAAAAVALALGLLVRERRAGEPGAATVAGTTPAPSEEIARADEELLLALDALENWELLTSADLDLLLAGLDASEQLLLELEAAEPEGATPDRPDAPGDESKNG